jgi:hypothetical protein
MFSLIAIDFLKKHAAHLVEIALLVGLLWGAYAWSYNRGELAANARCEERFAAQQKFRDGQITSIEGFAQANLNLTAASMEQLSKQINSIKPKGPLTNVPCTPTPAFISTANSIIDKANAK